MFHIVEDTEFAMRLLQEMLNHLGYDSMGFHEPGRYIAYVRSNQFQQPVATFVDVMMPDMNGYEMMYQLSATHANMKFVVATNETGIRSEYMHLACMYLAKPYHLERLTEVVSRLQQCHQCDVAANLNCKHIGDRKAFPIQQWSCPHPVVRGEECAPEVKVLEPSP